MNSLSRTEKSIDEFVFGFCLFYTLLGFLEIITLNERGIYLEPCQTSKMELFCEISSILLQKAPIEMFDRILNTPLGTICKVRKFKQAKYLTPSVPAYTHFSKIMTSIKK